MASSNSFGFVVAGTPNVDVRAAPVWIQQGADVVRAGTAENLHGMRPTVKPEFTCNDCQTMATLDGARDHSRIGRLERIEFADALQRFRITRTDLSVQSACV